MAEDEQGQCLMTVTRIAANEQPATLRNTPIPEHAATHDTMKGAQTTFHRPTRRADACKESQSPHSPLLLAGILCALLLLFPTVIAWPTGLPAGVSVQRIVSGIGWTTDIAFLTTRHTLVTTKDGIIYQLLDWRVLWDQPLLDLSYRVLPAIGDRGMTSMAVHPDLQANGKRGFVYVAYVDDPNKGCQDLGVLCEIKYNKIRRLLLVLNEKTNRFEVKQNLVVWGACTRMMESWWGDDCSPMVGTTHSIGGIWFGSDGKLWASVGEGQLLEGSFWLQYWASFAGTNRALSMDPNFLGGKILRMEHNTTDGMLRGLKDNPFSTGDVTKARSMVWAVGLRNPWRCAHYPPGTTQQVVCGVVGFFTYESVVRIQRGSNLGWPCWEGVTPTPNGGADTPICQTIRNQGAPAAGYPPVQLGNVMFVYDHNGVSAAAIGGAVLPSYFPAGWAGRYLFSDYARNTIWGVNPKNYNVQVFGQGGDGIVSMRISPFDNKVYVVTMCNECQAMGEIRRLEVAGYSPPKIRTTSRGPTTTKKLTGTAALCNPTDRIKVSPLPTEANGQPWETTMNVARGFPESRVKVLQNGEWGPVGVDSSVGPAPNSSLQSRVMSIGREFYTSGFGTHGDSLIQIDMGLGRCWKLVAKVGVDDEIHIGGEKTAWGEFIIKSGPQEGSKTLYSLQADRAKQNWPPIKSRNPASTITITNLTDVASLQLIATRPLPLATYPFNYTYGHYDWASLKLYCGPDAPYLPFVVINTPVGAAEYKIGDVVKFSGRALFYTKKVEIFNPDSFSWSVVLVHCQGYLCHQHQEIGSLKGRNGSFVITDHAPTKEQYYFYQIVLTVTDGCGRSDKAVKTVKVKGYSGEGR